jgi:DNA-binding NarL/FixJ family response regulator
MATRVLIVDDHVLIREGLRVVLERVPHFELVGEAASGQEAIALVATTQPDVVLMDLQMPGMNGVTATAHIRSAWPKLPVLILSSFVELDTVLAAIKAGASGYMLKAVQAADLLQAIRTVAEGRPYLHPIAQRHLVAASAQRPTAPVQLTQREQEVLVLLADGLTNRQIGDQLAMTEKTASVHVSNILRKLELPSRTQAALYLKQHGVGAFAPAHNPTPFGDASLSAV